MRNVVVLGSTGSVGRAALEVVRKFPGRFRITGLAAHTSVDELARQAREFKPAAVTAFHPESIPALEKLLSGTGVAVLGAEDCLTEMVSAPGTDVVLNAIVGAAGLAPAIAAIDAGKQVALANKEPIVAAGPILIERAERSGAVILPVDSEHSAIFQALRAGRPEEVRRILLTASGGPFRTRDPATLKDVSPEEALNHPTWAMGPKITVDSATMMNKALEVIEAVWLFGVSPDRIRVLIHPQSIVHSMVEFRDGSIVAQMGRPDMKLPILFALSWPERLPYDDVRFSLSDFRTLTFEDPEDDRYPALSLGYRAAEERGLAGAVLNAANERAVELFLAGQVPFTRVTTLAEEVLDRHVRNDKPSLADVLEADRWGRAEVQRCLTRSC